MFSIFWINMFHIFWATTFACFCTHFSLQRAVEVTIVCFITGPNPLPFLPQILVPDINSKPWRHPQGRRNSLYRSTSWRSTACGTRVYECGNWQWFMIGVQLEVSVTQPLLQVPSHNYCSELIYIHNLGLCIITFGRTGNRSGDLSCFLACVTVLLTTETRLQELGTDNKDSQVKTRPLVKLWKWKRM